MTQLCREGSCRLHFLLKTQGFPARVPPDILMRASSLYHTNHYYVSIYEFVQQVTKSASNRQEQTPRFLQSVSNRFKKACVPLIIQTLNLLYSYGALILIKACGRSGLDADLLHSWSALDTSLFGVLKQVPQFPSSDSSSPVLVKIDRYCFLKRRPSEPNPFSSASS